MNINKAIGERLKRNDKRHIARQEKAAHMSETSFTSHLEAEALKIQIFKEVMDTLLVHYAIKAMKLTNGAIGSGEPIVKKTRTRKPKVKVVAS
jgi:hypothetical protein